MPSVSFLQPGERLDDLQINDYHIIQNPEKFCFGMDAVLLSAFVKCKAGSRILDMGTGTGIIPILLAARTQAGRLDALEIQEDSADMARRSVLLNHLEQKIQIHTGDIKSASSLFPLSSFDIITSNPPYMNDQHGLKNPALPKAIARHEILCTLEDLVRESSVLLRPGGHFFMVHRPFRLVEIFSTLTKYRLEPKRMRLVQPYEGRNPNMILVEAVRGGNPQLTVEAPLIIYQAPGRYSEEIQQIYSQRKKEVD